MKLYRCDLCEMVSNTESNHFHLVPHNITENAKHYDICDECYIAMQNHLERSISNYNQDDYNHFQSGKVSEVQKLLDSLTGKEA